MNTRGLQIQALAGETFDVLVVGAGIQGAACAARLAAEGVKVALIDSGDFGSGTSQGSSHLIWGGIKYLENGEFKLVKDLCRARNQLVKRFPLSISPIRFLLCPQDTKRSLGKLMRMTWLYWLLGFFWGSAPRVYSIQSIKSLFSFIRSEAVTGAIEYSDAHIKESDARFVFHFVRKSQIHGGIVLNYMALKQACFENGTWKVAVSDAITGDSYNIRSRTIINAAGPWAGEVCKLLALDSKFKIEWSQGVHMVVKRIHPVDKVIATFADDGRLFYVVPFGESQTLIGTTDTKIDAMPGMITDADREFILRNANALLALPKPLSREDIVSELCGVRPLVIEGDTNTSDWFQASRRHVVEAHKDTNAVSIFGGKLTDCLNIADEVSKAIHSFGIQLRPLKPNWCGDAKATDYAKLVVFTSENRVDFKRLLARYGEDVKHIVELIQKDPQLNSEILEGGHITRAEVVYMAKNESIVTLEDFIRRRTMLATQFTKKQLLNSKGLREAAHILFGENAESQYKQFSDN
jgi:alpha-glycerophosphate oxidase/glycerol-3-phosphate dehydrogenase